MNRGEVSRASGSAGIEMAPKRKKMLILVASPLTEDIYRRIGAEEFEASFEVVVADCLDWLKRYDKRPAFSEKRAVAIIKTKSKEAFAALMQTEAPDFVLDFVGRGAFTKVFQIECRKINAVYITHHLVPVPTSATGGALWRCLLANPKETAAKVVRHIGRRMANNNPYPPDVSLLAGRKSVNPWVMSARAIIQTATPGYYELQKARIEWGASKGELGADIGLPEAGYILFIDDCLALSFDFYLGGFSPIVDAKTYFAMINGFFDRLEQLTGLPVVIAAHPNGKEYPGYAELFNGRRLYHDRTALLSCGCVCALTHYSSAINYPVILRKPVSVLMFDRLRNVPQGGVAEVIAATLERPVLDLSQAGGDSEFLTKLFAPPHEAAYATYEADYIVNTASPGESPFENLASYLSNLSVDKSLSI